MYPDPSGAIGLVGAVLAIAAFVIAFKLAQIHRTLQEIAKHLKK